jgi:hypothetical protein
MLGRGHPNCYGDVPIASDMSFNTMIELVIVNGLQMLELYLNSTSKKKLLKFGVYSSPKL